MPKFDAQTVESALQTIATARAKFNALVEVVNVGVEKADTYLTLLEKNIKTLAPEDGGTESETKTNPFSLTDQEEWYKHFEYLRTWFIEHKGEYTSNAWVDAAIRREVTPEDISLDALKKLVRTYRMMESLFGDQRGGTEGEPSQ